MKNRGINSYMAIAIGGLTLTVVGLSIFSYTRFRKRRSEKKGIERSIKSDEKLKAKYTTRHGSHLTKTTQGVSDTEADIKQEVKIS
jgi:hypothetical protein